MCLKPSDVSKFETPQESRHIVCVCVFANYLVRKVCVFFWEVSPMRGLYLKTLKFVVCFCELKTILR